MKLQISCLNNRIVNKDESEKNQSETWHRRWKTYISDWMDEDMKNSTVSHYVDRIIINDAQLTSKSSVDDMIEFLTKARESFKF